MEGVSDIWRRLDAQIAQVAPSQAPVLIQGETGSGKEVVARLLHARSRRAPGPCLAVNCGAVSRELLESELFGYEKGAFTGAATAKPGLIAAAEGGSLFLDEIGEMPGPMQVGLLRFLDRNEYRPVGSTRTCAPMSAWSPRPIEMCRNSYCKVDFVTISSIASTLLRCGFLRSGNDGGSSALSNHILNSLRIPGTATRTLTTESLQLLTTYGWPGNVRELRNVIERIVLLGFNTGLITREEVVQALPPSSAFPHFIDQTQLPLEEIERLHIERVLKASGGNKTKAAHTLQIDYKTLLTKLKAYLPSN